MERVCEVCGAKFETKRSHAKTCSGACRSVKAKGQVRELRPAATAGRSGPVAVVPVPSAPGSSVRDRVLAELVAAGREESALGAAAMLLAGRIDAGNEPGSALSALNRELRATLAEALRGSTKSSVGALRDELAERRRGSA